METVTRPPLSEPAFHADDGEQVAGYRTLSVMAIISLLFGLASALCFGSKLFLVIPVIGSALSLLALRRIAVSEGLLAGRFAAAAGLALCVAFAVAAISRDEVTRYLRTDQAEQFAREWIGLLQSGKTEEAFRMTADASRPAPMPEPGMPAAPPTNPYDEFKKQPLVAAVSAAGPDAEIKLDRTLQYDRQNNGQYVIQQQFTITPSKATTDAESHPVGATLMLQWTRSRGNIESRWLVARYDMPLAENDHDHDHDHTHDHAGH